MMTWREHKASNRIPIGNADGRPVFLSPERRAVHMHVIGASGQGKTKFLEHCIREDIKADHGVCLIDPEGTLYNEIVAWCAVNEIDKIKQVHLFDPTHKDWRFRFNPLYVHEGEKPRHRIDNVIEALAQVWGGEDSRSQPAIRTTLRAVLSALIASGYTLAEAFFLTSTKDPDQVVKYITHHVNNRLLQDIWQGYEDAPDREHMIEFGGTRRRFLELLEDDETREILAATDRPFDFKDAMNNGDIVLVNLAPEGIGEDPGRAFGAMLVREMFYCASRRSEEEGKEKPFFAYIDECPKFLTSDIADILARSRKRGLHVILAHQWLEQLRKQSEEIYHGVMGIQNKVVFGGLSDEDAVIMADQLFRSEYDLEIPIAALTKPGVAGYRRTLFSNWSSSEGVSDSETHTYSESSGESSMESSVASLSQGGSTSVNQLYDADGFPTGTYSVAIGESTMKVDARGVAVGRSTSEGYSYSVTHGTSSSQTEGMSEGLEPILKNFVGGVHSIENVKHMAVARLRSIPPRNAVVKGFDTPTFDITTKYIETPLVSDVWIGEFEERAFSKSPYTIEAEKAEAELLTQQRELYLAADSYRPGVRVTPGMEIEEDDDGLG